METINPELKIVQNLFDKLLKEKIYPFPMDRQCLTATQEKGVYIILDKEMQVLHIGRTPQAKGGIKQRLFDHLYSRSSFVEHYFNGDGHQLRDQECAYRYLVVNNSRHRALLEAYTIGFLCPKHIGVG